MIKGKGIEFTIEEFETLCKESESIREIVTKMGYSPDGGSSREKVKELILKYNIDTSHFKGQGHTKNIGKRRTSTESYLANQQKVTSHRLRLRLIEDGIFEKQCCCCGLKEWIGKPIPLELHHKNGNKYNNDIENLELRCPNCHYFTDTYKFKNRST